MNHQPWFGLRALALALVVLSPLASNEAIAASGGPDTFGYRWSDNTGALDTYSPVYTWAPISGTALTLSDDQLSSPISLPFPFTFYGVSYSQLTVSSNGYLSFTNDTNGCCSGLNPPNAAIPNGWVGFHWNDMWPPGTGGRVAWATGGVAPNRYFVVEFNAVAHCCTNGSNPASAQAWLYEGSTEIVFQINTATADGSNTTIGIENQDGTAGLLYASSATTGTFLSARAVRFYQSPPTNLRFSTAPQSTAVGGCSALTTVRPFDVNGTATSFQAATTVSLSATGGTVTFFSDASCATAISSVNVPSGVAAVNFYYRSSTSGSPVLTASAPSLTPGSQTATVLASRLAFLTAPQSVLNTNCSGLTTVQHQTGAGAALNVASATSVSLSGSSGTMVFYSDPACSAVVTSVTLPAGGNSASFYFRDPTFGATTITAASAGALSATQVATIISPEPSEYPWRNYQGGGLSTDVVWDYTMGYQFTPEVGGRVTRLCGFFNGTKEVRLYDRVTGAVLSRVAVTSANAWSCASIAPVSVVAGSAYTVAVVLAGSGGSSRSVIPALPQTWNSVRVDGSCYVPGTIGEPCASSGLIPDTMYGQADIGFLPDPPNRLAIVSAAQTLAVGSCSSPVTVQSQNGAVASTVAADTQVTLSSSSGTLRFYAEADTTCATALTTVTIPAGGRRVSFRFSDTAAGTPLITAGAAGLTATSQTQTLTATRLVFSSSAQSITVGTCSGATTVQNRNASGSAVAVASSTTVTLTSSSADLVFFADASCTTAVSTTTIGAGTSASTFYFRGSSTEEVTLSAAAAAIASGSQAQLITPCTAYQTPLTTNATGSVSVNLSLNATVGYQFTPTTAGSIWALCGYFSGTNTVSLVNRSTGAVLGAAVVTSANTWSCTSISPVRVNANTAYSVAVSVSTGGAQRDLGNGTPNALPKTWGNITVQNGCSAGLGVTDPCTSSLSTRLIGGVVDIRFAPEVVTGLAYGTAPQSVAVGSCSSPAVLETRGCNGGRQRVSVATGVSLSSSAATTAFFAATDTTCATPLTSVTIPANADTVSFRFRDTTAGNPTLTASSVALASATQVQTIGAGNASRVVVSSAAQTLAAGACSAQATAQTRDNLGNPANVATATTVNLSTSATATGRFFSDASCTTQVSSVIIAAGANGAGFYFRDTAAGSPTLTVAVSGFTSGTQAQSITAAGASRFSFTSAAQSFTAGGCSALTSFRSEDSFGNVSSVGAATAATLASSSGGANFYSDPGCTVPIAGVSLAAGQSSGSFYFSDTVAGAPTLTVSATGFTAGTQGVTIVAGPPVLLAFSSAPAALAAGGCSGAVTVQARDAYGNPTVVGVSTALALGTSSGGGTFYQGAGCTTPISSATIVSGSGSTAFYYGDTAVGTPTLSASASGFVTATQTATVSAGAASRVAFASAAQTLAAGVCSAIATVQTRDSFGNPTAVGAATTVTLSSSSVGGTFFSNATCTTAVSAVLIAGGTSSATFYFRDTRAGTPTLTAAASGLTSGTQVQTINPGPVASLAFVSAAQSLTAGTCSAVATVESRDAFGNVSPVAGATAVTLSSDSPGGTFFSNATCGAAIAGVTIPAGASSVGFFFRDTRAGSPVLTAASSGVTSATQTQTISAAAAARLAMTTPARAPVSGACSLAVTVTAQDAFANASNLGASTPVNLASSAGASNTFFADATCSTAVTSGVIAGGTSSVSFYFRDTVVGSPTLTASAAGFTSGTQVQTVTAAPPSVLAFVTSSQTLSAGSCSAITSVQARDAFNNPSTVAAATTVGLSSTAGTTSFYSNASCTTAVISVVIGLGGTTASFYFRDSSAGSPALTASAAGFTNATQVQTITAAAANRLVFVTSSQTIAAGACSALTTIQAQDALGAAANVPSATTVALSSSSASTQYFADSSCSVAVTSVTIAAGTSSGSFYFRDTTAGSLTLTGASGSFTSGNQAETIVPAAASLLVFSSAAQSLSAGSCSAVGVVQSRDAFSNVSNVGAATTVNLGSTSGANAFYADASCTTVVTSRSLAAGTSSVTFYFRDNTAGSPTLTASATGFASGTQGQVINAGAPARLAFSTPPRTQLAGACSAVITVQTQDGFGNATNVGAATAVSLSTGSSGGLFFSDASCATAAAGVTVPAGSSSANLYYRDTRAGTAVVSATSAGLSTATQSEVINPAGAVKVVFTTPARTVTAGACSAIATTTTQDLYDNTSPVTAATTLSYSAAPADVTFFSNSTCTTAITTQSLAAGASTTNVYFRSNVAGSKTLTVAASGLTSATQGANINPDTASRIAFATAAQTVTAGACSPITTVRAQDSLGNTANVSAATAVALSNSSGAGTFFSNSTCTTAIASVTIGAGTSSANFYWRDTRAGSSTLTGSATGFTSGTQVQTIVAAAVSRLSWTSAPLNVSAGACSTGLTVQRQDVYGNAVTGGGSLAVGLASTSSGNSFSSTADCGTAVTSATISPGNSALTVYLRDTVAGTPTLTASAAGLTSGTQMQTIVSGSASRLAFTSAAQSLIAGACSALATVSAQDTFGNPASVGAATTIAVSSSAGGTNFYSDASCTTAVSGVTIPAVGQSAGFYFRITTAGAATLTAAATGFTSGTQVQTIGAGVPSRLVFTSAAQTVAAGSCSGAAAVVRAEDAFGNAANVGASTSVNLSSSSATGVFSAAAGCASTTTNVSIAAGTNSASFFFRDPTAGAPVLTASAVGLTAAAQAQTVTAAAATALDFVSAPQTLPAGGCSAAATVLVRDSFGNPAPGATARTVSLSASSGTLFFFADAACGTLASSIVIPAGASTGNFYFRESAAGTPTLTASSSGLTFATQGQTILAGAPSTIAFVSPPQTLIAGACSALTTVQSRDGNSNRADVTAPTSVGLGTSSSGGAFFSDTACTIAIASVTIPAGGNTAGFYFRDSRVGTPTLSLTAVGLASSTQIETINAGPASRLGFTSAAQNVVAGSCSGALVIQSQDAFSNAVLVSSATTVGLASSSGSNVFYSNATCTTVITSAALAASTSAVTVYFLDTLAGTPTLTASAAGLTSGTQVQTVRAAAPNRLAFVSTAQAISAGACSALATVQTRDTYSNPSAVSGGTAVGLTSSSSAGGRFYSDAACSAEVTSITIPSGASSAGFYFRDTNAGSPTLTAASAGLTSATQVQTINPAAASRLVFTTAAQTLTAGGCSGAISLQSQDTAGNPSNVASATSLSLTSNSTGGTFFSNSTCTTVVTTATLAAGTSTTTFWYRDDVAGASTVTAAATGFTSGTQTQTINAAAASRLAFTTAAQTQVAGTCSAVASLQSRDAFNNPSNVTAATAVTLSSSSAGGTFYSDAACATPIAGLTIAAGTRTGSFYFRDTRAGTPTLTAAAVSLSSATQAQTSTPAAPQRLAITSAAQTLSAGACSAAVSLQVQDTFGNASPVSGATAVSLSSSSTGATFFSGAGCTGAVAGLTLAAGSSSAVFYFRDTSVGTPTLTAAATGLLSATQGQTINAAAASRLAFLTPSQSLTAGACSGAVTVQSQDAFNNPSNVGGATAVTFVSTSTGNAFYFDAACSAAVTGLTLSAGTNQGTLYFRDTRAGSPTVTASAPGLSSADQAQSISPAAASRLAFTNAPLTLTAGSCSSGLTITSQDTYGNLTPVSASTVVTLSTSSSAGSFYTSGTCGTAGSTVTLAAGATSATVFYGDTRAGTPTLTAAAAGFTSGTQAATVNPAAATRLAFTSAAQTVTAGVCSVLVNVQAQDTFGNPVNVASTTTVSLTTNSPGGAFAAVAGCGSAITSVTLSAGSSTVGFYFRDTRSGASTLTAAASGLASAGQVQTVNPAAPARLSFASGAQTVVAGGCSALATVRTQDAFGNTTNVSAASAVGLSSSSTGASFFSNSTCTTAVSSVTVVAGTSSAGFYFRDTRAGTPTITVTASGLTIAAQGQTITPASPTQLVFTSAPQTVVAGNCSGAATIQARDAFNNASPVGAATSVSLTTTSPAGTFFANATCTVAIAATSLSAGTSTTTFFFRDTQAGTPTLTAAESGLTAATQLQTITPAAATRLAFTSAPQTLVAGTCSAPANVQAQDAFGNAAPLAGGATLTLATSSGAGGFFVGAGCGSAVGTVGIAPGASAASFAYRDTLVGTPTLTVSATGLTLATQGQVITPAPVAGVVFVSLQQTLTAGACSAFADLRTRDAFGNVSAVTVATALALSTTSSGGSFFSDPACAAPVASVTLAAGTSGARFYFLDTRVGTPTLTAAAAGLVSATQVNTIVPAAASRLAFTSASQSLTAGACSALTSLQSQDAFGNPANVPAAATVALSTDSPAGAFYSDAACSSLVTSASIAAGANGAAFYFIDTRAGAPTLTLSAVGLTSATQVQDITPAAASRLAFVTLAQSVTAGTCSAIAQVQSQDVYGNPSNVNAATPVNLSSTSATFRFFSDASCTTQVTQVSVAASANLTSFFFADTAAGTPTASAASAGLVVAPQVETINPAPASRLVVTTAPRTVIAGACSSIVTVQSQDALGNASPVTVATAISLATSSSGGTFFSDSSCAVPVSSVTVAAASSTVSFYFRDTRAGSPTLSGASSGFASATQVELITPAAPARLVVLTASQSRAAGTCSGVVTVQTQDTFGNPSNVSLATTLNLATNSSGGTFHASAACGTAATTSILAPSTNTTSFYFRDTLAGSPLLTFSSTGLSPVTQTQTITPAAASQVVFTSAAQTLVVGNCSAAASVQTRDPFGNASPVAAATAVALSSTSATGTFFSDATCTTAIAQATIASGSSAGGFYFRDTRSGTATLTAAPSGLTLATQLQTFNPAPATRLVFTTAALNQLAGACSGAVTLQARDSFGNASNVAAATTVTLATSSTGGTFSAAPGCGATTSSVSLAAGTSAISFHYRDTLVGTPTLTPSAAGFTVTTQAQTITPASATVLAFTSAPQTLVAGACSSAASLQTRDTFGNVAPLSAPATVGLSTSSSGGAFYVDATCTTVAGTLTLAAGATSGLFYFRDTRAGTPVLTLTATGLTVATQSQTINPAALARLSFVTGAQTLIAGTCSALTTLRSEDAFGNARTVASPTSLALSSGSATTLFYADAACSVALSSVTIAAGGSSAGFYFRDTTVGTPTLTGASPGLASGTQTQTINPAAPNRLVFTTAAQTVLAGSCSGVATVQVRDVFGNPSPVSSAATVSLASTSGTGTFAVVAGCGSAASSATLSAGTTTVSFYFRDTVIGTPTLTAASTGLVSATQVQTVNPAAPAALVFTTASQTLVAGACSAVTGLQTRDSFGNPSSVTAATTVGLATNSPGGGFFSDSTCLSAISSLALAAGANARTFYFRDTRAGSATLTLSATGLTPATQVATINPGASTVIAITTPARAITAGGCSAVVSMQTRDTFGNAAAVTASSAFTLSSDGATTVFYSDNTCSAVITTTTLAAGANAASFYFRATLTGTPSLTLARAGYTSATQVQTVNPAAAIRLAFTSAAQTVVAGACSALTVTRTQDTYGNAAPVAAATTVGLSSSGGGIFYSDSGCTAALSSVAVAAGASTVNAYVRHTLSGTPTLTASATGLTSATQLITINPAAPIRLAFATAPQTLLAGGCSAVMSVQTRDTFGNASRVTTSILATLNSASLAGSFYADPSCNSPIAAVTVVVGTSLSSFYYQDTLAGPSTLTASSAGFSNATQVATILPAAASRVSFVTAPQTLSAGSCSAIATVEAQDAFGNASPLGPVTTVALSSTSSTGTFSAIPGCGSTTTSVPMPAGQSRVSFYFRDSVTGTPTLSATPAGLSTATQLATIVPASAAVLAFSTAPQTLNAGACSALITVETRDGNGNASAVLAPTTVNLTTSGGTGAFFTDSSCTVVVTGLSLPIGSSTFGVYFKDTAVGSRTLTAAATGFVPATQVATITTAGSATRLAFTSVAQSVVAGGCSALAVVQSQDSFGNAVNLGVATPVALSNSAVTGAFFSNASCTTPVSVLSIAAGGNTVTFYFRDTRAGTPTLTAAAAGLSNAAQVQTINPGAPTALGFITPARTMGAGVCSPSIGVRVQDSFGNTAQVTTAAAVALTSSSTAGTFYSDAACTSLTLTATIGLGGSATTFYYSDTRSGSAIITVASQGRSSATQIQTISTGVADRLAFVTQPQALTAGGCSALTSVQAQDGLGNPTPVSVATVISLSTASSGGSFYSDPVCANAITARTLAVGGATITFYFKDTQVGSPTLTVSTLGLTTATQVQTVLPGAAAALAIVTVPRVVSAGACSRALLVEARDELGNTAAVQGPTSVVPSTSTVTGDFFADEFCATSVIAVTIPTGGSSANLYYRDTLAGTPVITVANPGLLGATQLITVTPAAADHLTVVSAPQTTLVGACSALATFEVRDAFSNTSSVVTDTVVTLMSTSSTARFFFDASCTTAITSSTIVAAGSQGTFFFSDTTAGTADVRVAAASLLSGSQAEVFTPGAAVGLGFSTPARTVVAGVCSEAVTLEARDSLNNPTTVATARALALVSSSSGLRFFSDSGCTTPITTAGLAAGAGSVTVYVRDSLAGSSTLTAREPSLGDITQAATVVAAAVAKLAFSTAPPTVASTACSRAVVLEARDAFDNAADVTADERITLSSSSATTAFFFDDVCANSAPTGVTIPSGSSFVGLYFRDDTAGTSTLTATSVTLGSANQRATVTAGPAIELVFRTQPQTLPTGVCSAATTVEARDVSGNPAPAGTGGVSAALSSTSSGNTFYSDVGCTRAVTTLELLAGQSSGTFHFKDSVVGSPNLDVVAAGLTPARQQQSIFLASTPVGLGFVGAPATLEAGRCSSAIELQTQDVNGAPAPLAAPITAALSLGSTVARLYSDATCTTEVTSLSIAAQDYRATFFLKDSIVEPVVIQAQRAGLTGGSVTVQIICPATLDGAFCDDGDLCNGRERCVAGRCNGSPALVCDDNDSCTIDSCSAASGCANVVASTCCTKPVIARDGNLVAAVGVPYRLNAAAQLTLLRGTGPITWAACATGPLGLRVDATTGAVDWTPGSVGPSSVCLQATGSCGVDAYSFTVNVLADPGAAPVAVIRLPGSVAAGVPVTADGSASTPSAGLTYAWSFGDGTAIETGPRPSHVYARAGGYDVRLTVFTPSGQSAQAQALLRVTSESCPTPPTVRIVADQTSGAGPLAVQLSADYQGDDPNAVLRWSLGDGTAERGTPISHTFGPGAHLVVLEAINRDGCTARDQLVIRVEAFANRPPHCAVTASPVAGVAPLATTFSAVYGDSDGRITSASWLFSDGVSADALRFNGVAARVLDLPGGLTATLEVTDDQGATCRSTVLVEAGNGQLLYPPEIVSVPTLTAQCDQPWTYGTDGVVRASGSRPLTFELGQGTVGAPEGMTVDDTGAVSWTPVKGKGKRSERVTLVAQNAAGSVEQDFMVEVECAPQPSGCSCSTFSGSAVWLFAVAALTLVSRRRRVRARSARIE